MAAWIFVGDVRIEIPFGNRNRRVGQHLRGQLQLGHRERLDRGVRQDRKGPWGIRKPRLVLKIPEDILFSKAGDLYVANLGDNNILEFSATGKSEGVFANVGLNHPDGLAFDAAGRLYVFNEGDGTVHLFSPSGKDRGVFVKAGIMKTPLDLAFDSAGNLYAADNANHVVDEFDKNGKLVGTVGGRTSLFHPLGLVFDPAGNLFVSNYGANTIREFDKNGKDDGTFARGLQGPEFMVIVSAPEPSSIVMLGLGMIAMLGYAAFWRGS